MTQDLRIEPGDDVLSITLARPDRRNAITVAMYAALADAIEAAARDDSVRVITIRGQGQDFTAGNDLMDFLAELPRQSEDIPVWRFLRALANNQVPIVAAVQGNAVGIGTTMLFHCDLVIAAASARFSLPFVDLGLVPEAASTLLLPRIAGRRRSARYLLLGESFGAQDALESGLVSHVVEDAQLDSAFVEIVGKLLAKPRDALRITQQLLRHGTSEEMIERMELESSHFSERLQSAEVRDSIAAFFEARRSASAH
jgi:enoyl-CoA hydratase/carnithine racemase